MHRCTPPQLLDATVSLAVTFLLRSVTVLPPERDNYRFLVLLEEIGDGLAEYLKRHCQEHRHRLMDVDVRVMMVPWCLVGG